MHLILRSPLKRVALLAACALLALACVASAQQTSATLMGVVKDHQGAVIPGAKVVVVNQVQGAVVRELKSEPDGSFVVTPLNPATYTLVVEATGFKKFEQKDIKLFPNDRISVTNIVLEVGQLTETITVTAETVQLETTSAERSGIVTGVQTVNLLLNGRNYLGLIGIAPGIVSTFDGQIAGPGGIGNIFANGQRGDQNNVTLDGVTNMDTGSNGTQHTSLNIDAVAEFKVISGTQPADFGRATGAAINIVTKSGSAQFHGTGYWFHRHEGLNANTWRNNQDNLARKKYRYNYQGYNIGGPIYWPGKFNSKKDKLFFFWAQEWQKQLVANATQYVTVPTPAERGGDFSASHFGDNSAVIITDPTTGLPFSSNKIPQNRWNADGQKILNWYPQPNVTGNPAYNYQSQISAGYPRRQEVVRVDYNINERWRAFVRYIRDKDDQIMPYGQWNANYNIPFGPMHFGQPGRSSIFNLTTIVNPTLTNEFIFGFSRNRLDITPVDDAFMRSKLNLSYAMPFPNADPLGLVQNWQWGGVPSGPTSSFNGTPFLNVNNTFDFTDNMTKVLGSHQIKFGVFTQRSRKDQTAFTPANGTINFARDSQNPGDTNWAFSNGLLGNFQTLQQSSIIRNGLYRYTNFEWYVMDIWKVTPTLTLDYGMRFYYIQPQYDAKLQTSSFNPSLFDKSAAAKLYQRAVNPATGKVAAYNPLNSQYYPAAYIGALLPNVGKWENGAYDNGMGRAGLNGYPQGLINSTGIHFAPRLGIAWHPFTKTVFRAGGGVYYDRFEGNPVFDMLPNPPSTIVPTLYYGNLATIGSTPGVLFPGGVRGFALDGTIPVTYNWNIGFQHQLPYQILFDAAYVGSVSRHQIENFDVNRPGFGSAWLPATQDPTVAAPKFDGTTTLPVNFYRPYQGYGSVNITEFGADSNYNALQVAANRRLAKGLQLGVSYTFSKTLGTANAYGDNNWNPVNVRMGNYAPLSFDRRHVLGFNYVYFTPKIGKNGNFLDNIVGRAIFNSWTLSGITSMSTGSPGAITYSVPAISNLARVITGDETYGPRPLLLKNPQISTGQRTIYNWIDSTAVAPAVKGSMGMDSALRGYIYNPGINNWDVSVFKSFPFSKEEGRMLQLRLEMFNAPNHTQFSGFNASANLDLTGKVTNLPTAVGGTGGRYGFGAINGVRDPRIVQLAVKFYF